MHDIRQNALSTHNCRAAIVSDPSDRLSLSRFIGSYTSSSNQIELQAAQERHELKKTQSDTYIMDPFQLFVQVQQLYFHERHTHTQINNKSPETRLRCNTVSRTLQSAVIVRIDRSIPIKRCHFQLRETLNWAWIKNRCCNDQVGLHIVRTRTVTHSQSLTTIPIDKNTQALSATTRFRENISFKAHSLNPYTVQTGYKKAGYKKIWI
jgi:hypothetical protein